MEVLGGCLINLVEPVPLIFLGSLFGAGGEGDSGSFREKTYRLTEVNALLLHNEGKDIAAGVAGTEAVPALLFSINKEGGVLFAVKGA